jgi:CRISPR-associated endonuclease/helicase Cas3
MADSGRAAPADGGNLDRVLGALLAKTPRYAGNRVNLLLSHLLDTAAVAGHIWDHFLARSVRDAIDRAAGGPGRGRLLLMWLCGIHDIGKATPAYQLRFPDLQAALAASGLSRPGILGIHASRYHHTLAGAAVIRRQLRAAGWPREHVRWVWPIVAGHHGVFPEAHGLEPPPGSLDDLCGDASWERAQDETTRRLVTGIGAGSLAELVPARRPGLGLQLLLAGVVMMADWIASTRTLSGLATLPEVSFPVAAGRAAELWRQHGLRGGWGELPVPGPETFARRFGLAPRPVQIAAQRAAEAMEAPGLQLIEAPTGAGKTLACLIAAETLAARFGLDGVFVGLPAGAVAEPAFGLVRDWVTGHDPALRPYVALLDGNRNFEPQWTEWQALPPGDPTAAFAGCGDEDDHPDADPGPGAAGDPADAADGSGERAPRPDSWFIGGNRGLLCPFVVAPVDELLRAAVRTTVASVRMAGLMGKVVVLDEVHALDLHASRLLLEVVRWLAMARVPVVAASATLTGAQRDALVHAYAEGAAGKAAGDPYPAVRESREAVPGAAVTAVWHTASGFRHRVLPIEGEHPGPRVEVEVHSGPLPPPGAAPWDVPGDAVLVKRVRREAGAQGSALVVRATVERAQSFAAELGEGWDGEVVLLHERLPARVRARRAAGCLRRLAPGAPRPPEGRRPLVVVSTGDLAGQSFDIDAGFLAADLAPIDLLLQYAGRLRRGARSARGRLLVTGLDLGDGTRAPRLLAESVERHGAHLLLRSAALVLAAAGTGEAWTPSRTADLVASGYREDGTGLPPAWAAEASDALRKRHERAHDQWETAERYTLSRHRRTTATLAGLHRLSVSPGRDDADLLALLRGGTPATEVVLLHHEDGRYATVLGTPLGRNGTSYDRQDLQAVRAATVEVPEHWNCWTILAGLGLAPDRDVPMGRVRALVLTPGEAVEVAGRLLRYDSYLGLHEVPAAAGPNGP